MDHGSSMFQAQHLLESWTVNHIGLSAPVHCCSLAAPNKMPGAVFKGSKCLLIATSCSSCKQQQQDVCLSAMPINWTEQSGSTLVHLYLYTNSCAYLALGQVSKAIEHHQKCYGCRGEWSAVEGPKCAVTSAYTLHTKTSSLHCLCECMQSHRVQASHT